MIRYLLSRIGCLMLLVGIVVLVIGVAAARSGEPAFEIVLAGIGLTFLGFLLWNKLRTRSERKKRFSAFRREKDEDQHGNDKEDDGWN